jgi:hypothetical protein
VWCVTRLLSYPVAMDITGVLTFVTTSTNVETDFSCLFAHQQLVSACL